MSKGDVRYAVRWSAIDVLIRKGFSFAVLMILARLLAPGDFGVVAMLGIFISVASLFVDGGFGQAIIQRKNLTIIDESSVFYFNIFMGGVIALLLVLFADWFAKFYEQPVLKSITYAMALNLFINSFGSIHNSLLRKELEFKLIAKANIVTSILTGTLAIIAAWYGLGVWSLVLPGIFASFIKVIMYWWFHRWRPHLSFSIGSLNKLFGFSGYIVLSGLMYRIYGNIYAMVIGKFYPAADVGYFTQAQSLNQLPVTYLTSVVGRVAFPTFSSVNDSREKLEGLFGKALSATVFMSVPIAVLLAMSSESIIQVVLGNQWLVSAPILQVMSIATLLMPMQMLNVNIMKAIGRADLNFRVMVVKFTFGISLLALAAPYGLQTIAWAFIAANIINFIANTYYTKKMLDYGAIKQLKRVTPYILSGIPMVLALFFVKYQYDFIYYIDLLISVTIGIGVYILTCWLFRLEALEHLISVISGRLNK